MIKELFFIHSFPFSKEAYNSNDFAFFLALGYHVKFLDIANLIKHCEFEKNYSPFLKQHIISIESRKDFERFLATHKKRAIIITDVGLLAKTAWVYNSIFKHQLPYILFERPTFQIGTLNTTNKTHDTINKHLSRLNIKKIWRKPREIMQYLWAKQHKYGPQLILTSKEQLSAEKKALKTKESTVYKTVNPDYITAKHTHGDRPTEEPYAVFIDQYFVHHPDFKSHHIVHHFTAEAYYQELNNYLLHFSQKNDLKIIIAAHPRRTAAYEKDFNADFAIFQNQTANLIKHAEIVLMHFSTALNFAVIFQKPFLLLDSQLFNKSNIRTSIEAISHEFKIPMTAMDKLEEETHIPPIDTQEYQRYFHNYLAPQEAIDKSFKDFILEALNPL